MDERRRDLAPGAPDELIAAWLEGRLVRGDNACDGHLQHRGDRSDHLHDGPCDCAR